MLCAKNSQRLRQGCEVLRHLQSLGLGDGVVQLDRPQRRRLSALGIARSGGQCPRTSRNQASASPAWARAKPGSGRIELPAADSSASLKRMKRSLLQSWRRSPIQFRLPEFIDHFLDHFELSHLLWMVNIDSLGRRGHGRRENARRHSYFSVVRFM